MPPSPECIIVERFTLGMAAGMERMIESWNLCVNERSDRHSSSLVYTSDAKLRIRVKALGTQVMGSGTLLSQRRLRVRPRATLRATMEPTDNGHSPDSADGSGRDNHVNEELPTICTTEARMIASIRDERGREKTWGFWRFVTRAHLCAVTRGDRILSRARVRYMARCQISPPTVMRASRSGHVPCVLTVRKRPISQEPFRTSDRTRPPRQMCMDIPLKVITSTPRRLSALRRAAQPMGPFRRQ